MTPLPGRSAADADADAASGRVSSAPTPMVAALKVENERLKALVERLTPENGSGSVTTGSGSGDSPPLAAGSGGGDGTPPPRSRAAAARQLLCSPVGFHGNILERAVAPDGVTVVQWTTFRNAPFEQRPKRCLVLVVLPIQTLFLQITIPLQSMKRRTPSDSL